MPRQLFRTRSTLVCCSRRLNGDGPLWSSAHAAASWIERRLRSCQAANGCIDACVRRRLRKTICVGERSPPSRVIPTLPKTSLYGKEGNLSMSTVLAFKSTKRSSPSIENGKVVPPRRVTNLSRRSREHLTQAEVERLIAAAGKAGRHGVRDGTLILLAYRHGLRVSELVELRWEQV